MRGDDVRWGADVRSISDMAGESLLLGGGGRAILLQLANPAVGHGVADHSDFVDRPLARLHGTMTYLYAIVYGSEEESAAVRRLVDRAHAPVRSDASSSVAYDAHDPQLQLWVAATLYDSAIDLYERVYGPVAASEAVYRDYERVGTALQLPPGAWPADRATFRAWWDARLGELVVDGPRRTQRGDPVVLLGDRCRATLTRPDGVDRFAVRDRGQPGGVVGVGREVWVGPEPGQERLRPGVVRIDGTEHGAADTPDPSPVVTDELVVRWFRSHHRRGRLSRAEREVVGGTRHHPRRPGRRGW